MYEHVYYVVCYRKKEVRARLLKRCTSTSIIVKKMYEHVYYRKSTSIKKDVRARLLS